LLAVKEMRDGGRGGDLSVHRVVDVAATRAADPLNEFGDNKRLFAGAFPELFLTGPDAIGGPRGSLSDKVIHHMLHQFTGVFGRQARFLFTILDQKRRHAVTRIVSSRVKNNPDSLVKFGEIIDSDWFGTLLESALKDPTGGDARKVLKIVSPHLRLIGRDVPYGPIERKQVAFKLYAMVHRYGLPSMFLTLAPDDQRNPNVLRMCFPSKDNVSFPADPEGFLDALRSAQDKYKSIPLGRSDLRRMVCGNPVAAAETFREVIEAVFEELLGLQLDHKSRKSVPYSAKSGIFGKAKAAFAVFEAQGGSVCVVVVERLY
jgi:hypothetical protein